MELVVVAPADGSTTDGEQVQVRGRVTPAAAEVHVLGRRVDVTGGTFVTEVDLDEGANLIDVAASAAGRRATSTAVRVVREVPVEIPDLEGEDARSAIEELRALRLVVQTRDGGGLLDDLLGGDEAVCSISPEPGTEVRPGATVTVETARSC